MGQEVARASIHLLQQVSTDRNVCVFANYRTNPLSRPCKLSFCNCAASPQPAMLPVSCVAGFALNSLNSCRDHMRTTKMQSAISRIFSEPSTTIAFCASDCRQAQVGRCSKAFKSIRSCIWTTRHHTACRSSARIASSWRGTLGVSSSSVKLRGIRQEYS